MHLSCFAGEWAGGFITNKTVCCRTLELVRRVDYGTLFVALLKPTSSITQRRGEKLLIALIRCDDRLIHGQCMTAIVTSFAIRSIIVIDDFTATNPLLRSIFEKAVPPSMKASVYTTEGSYEPVKKALTDDVKTLVLFKNPVTYKCLLENVPGLPKELMIGPMSSKPGAKEVNSGTYLSAKDAQIVEELVNNGISVYFQILPTMKRFSWADVKAKLN